MGHSKVIAKNTIFLYIRTLLIMLISIYTSRVLLYKLGVDNFGIYNLVGGVVATFASLRGVFAQSVQRFLNFEKGKGNNEKVRDIFNISLYIHIVLGLVFGILVYIFGSLYIPHYLVLPEGALDTVMFVFYCTVLTSIITIITIPYDSVIIAYECFDFYAIISILDVLARLGILYVLWIGPDVLRTYAILIVLVTLIFRLAHIIYATRFAECKLKKIWSKQIFKELAGFSWWNFLGNTAYFLTNEGVNFIINIFGGVVANAARGLAYQVKTAVTQLAGNIGIASRPYISEAVATKDKQTIFNYVTMVSRAMFLMVSLTVLPILVYTEQILDIWLVDVPDYTVAFVQLVMIHMVIRSPQTGIDLLFSSYGKMRNYQIVQSIILLGALPLAYILLRANLSVNWAFIGMCIIELFALVAIVICAAKELGFSIINYIQNFVIGSITLSAVFTFIGFVFYKFIIPSNALMVLVSSVLLVIVGLSLSYIMYLSKQEKALIKSF